MRCDYVCVICSMKMSAFLFWVFSSGVRPAWADTGTAGHNLIMGTLTLTDSDQQRADILTHLAAKKTMVAGAQRGYRFFSVSVVSTTSCRISGRRVPSG